MLSFEVHLGLLMSWITDLGRRLPGIHARIWPARFVDREASEDDKDYQGSYLIGLDRLVEKSATSGPPPTTTKDEAKVAADEGVTWLVLDMRNEDSE